MYKKKFEDPCPRGNKMNLCHALWKLQTDCMDFAESVLLLFYVNICRLSGIRRKLQASKQRFTEGPECGWAARLGGVPAQIQETRVWTGSSRGRNRATKLCGNLEGPGIGAESAVVDFSADPGHNVYFERIAHFKTGSAGCFNGCNKRRASRQVQMPAPEPTGDGLDNNA